MTIAHIVVPADPVAHGFRPGRGQGGHPTILVGSNPTHAARLKTFQAAVRTAARQWLTDHNGDWPHYRQPIALGYVAWIRRPTTYRAVDVWHRTSSTGDTTTLVRAAEDALTGILYADDGQVAVHYAAKPVIPRNGQPATFLWVGPASAEQQIVDLARRRLPQGPIGPPRDPPNSHPVLSDAHAPTGDPSIPGLSSPIRTSSACSPCRLDAPSVSSFVQRFV